MNVIWLIGIAIVGVLLLKELVILFRLIIDPDYCGPNHPRRTHSPLKEDAEDEEFWRNSMDHSATDSRAFTDPMNLHYQMRKFRE